MRSCLITLEPIPEDGPAYSTEGLHKLSRSLKKLSPLEYTIDEQIVEAAARSHKMSIQGVQPKLSAVLKVNQGRFEIVDNRGRFILKPCPPHFKEVPANEALTMTLAHTAGIETPDHGLVYAIDQSLTYWIKRFDRGGRSNKKFPQEDFAQLTGKSRETKYDSLMEKVVKVIEQFCTFPVLEKRKLAELVIFCFLIGNEDMHLKNFSLVTRYIKNEPRTQLSPAYDLLNSTIVLKNAAEEMALPMNGKKRNLTKKDLLKAFCRERCGVSEKFLNELLHKYSNLLPTFHELIDRSHLSVNQQDAYHAILAERAGRLGITS